MMQRCRALALNASFYLVLLVVLVLAIPTYVMPRAVIVWVFKRLIQLEGLVQRCFGIKIEVRGREHLPAGGFLLAAKHQSLWETFMLVLLCRDVAFVYKKELGRIPLFGAYLRKLRMIEIDRGKGVSAMALMTQRVEEEIAAGRQVVLFPEGTRRPPGAPAQYKFGVANLYAQGNLTVVPVALNSGLFWSHYAWRGERGTIVIDILPPLLPGLPRDAFFAQLQDQLERASDALLLEAVQKQSPRVLPPSAQDRVKQLLVK